MKMIEKVARGICKSYYKNLPDLADAITEKVWKRFIPDAKAAIEAMKDPTEEMIALQYDVKAYQNMIEAALKYD